MKRKPKRLRVVGVVHEGFHQELQQTNDFVQRDGSEVGLTPSIRVHFVVEKMKPLNEHFLNRVAHIEFDLNAQTFLNDIQV